MRRDTIFYQIFQQFPELLFDLLPNPPANQDGYTFDSVEVKETSFRIDGIFRPPNHQGTVFFTEVQFQRDDLLYERLNSEASIYTYRHHDTFNDWQAIAIYPDRHTEQPSTKVPQELFASGRIQPIYLDQLGQTNHLPLSLLGLTLLEGETAIAEAQRLLAQAKRIAASNAIMDMIATIMVYKFTTISRDEVYKMLNYTLDELKQTRFYQEVSEEGREEGREEERRSLIWHMLNRKLGNIDRTLKTQFDRLTIGQVTDLGDALFNFDNSADLAAWLEANT
jgi:predicted transposase/invertase (TIGR01784 family)